MPPLQVTVPAPVPAGITVSPGFADEVSKVAVTVRLLITVTVQVALAAGQAPPQLDKVVFGVGAAVKITTVPDVTVIVQTTPQLIPAGFDVKVPVAVPVFTIVRVAEVEVDGG
jgi:hypothetical protein